VWLNGHEVETTPVRSRVDSQMRELDLSGAVASGRNVLAVRLVLRDATGGIVDHVKIVGSFAVAGTGASGYRIVAAPEAIEPRSWAEQGYPFLSGRGTYRTTFELEDGFAGRALLDVPMRDDVLEVEVNGRSAGVCLWDPYSVDVTEVVRPGRNELALVVANTPANLLNGTARPSGIAGPPLLRLEDAGAPEVAGERSAAAS
jgi:hypothetical protein